MTLVETSPVSEPPYRFLDRAEMTGGNSRLRIGICSTYAPRACGLATFAGDLERALAGAPGVGNVGMFALQSAQTPMPSTSESVLINIDSSDPASYRAAANVANSTCDVVIVQHEFGIFGGTDGVFILHLLDALRVPVVLTLHTVLPHFTASQRDVLRQACARAAVVTVFSATAKRLLLDQGVANTTQITIVPHGSPDELYDVSRTAARRSLDVRDRFVLSTFGLVSEGKGIELAIDALPTVVAARPDTLFVVAGRTHPEVLKRDRERYRELLMERVDSHGLGDHVRFVDGFLPVPAIAELLAATDVFLTPYVNPFQIVSGALTFALAAGCPVVSTPYLYARDCLADGAGTVVESRDPAEFGDAVLGYALSPLAAANARTAAQAFGASSRWSTIGRVVANICRNATRMPTQLGLSRAFSA